MTSRTIVETRPRRTPKTPALSRGGYVMVGTILAIVAIGPIVTTVIRSFQGRNADAQGLTLGSLTHFTWRNYSILFSPSADILHYAVNSAIVGIVTALVALFAAVTAGYVLARVRARWVDLVFLVVLAPIIVPIQGLLTPLSVVLKDLGLLNTLAGVILVLATYQLPFSIFVMRNAFATISVELEESARLDGCSQLQVMLRVILPLSWPGFITVGLFGFMAGWNDLITSVTFLSNQSTYTLPIALTLLSTHSNFGISVVDPGLVTGATTIAALPVVALFLLLQRYYAEGLIAGSSR
ncbi:carbohydrate ABC transporter permease [Curtobacterium ammoniigenes]|uniref:carbohydrate ABC transporter permease n=1 Tax=Curtobacterium ammoniigenes TaxID=395387 RepID=UPI00082B978E|nr:carbohydrate ABC transporter permease [Curtobacterium ammoniigenes]